MTLKDMKSVFVTEALGLYSKSPLSIAMTGCAIINQSKQHEYNACTEIVGDSC